MIGLLTMIQAERISNRKTLKCKHSNHTSNLMSDIFRNFILVYFKGVLALCNVDVSRNGKFCLKMNNDVTWFKYKFISCCQLLGFAEGNSAILNTNKFGDKNK